MSVYEKFKLAILPLAIVDGDKQANLKAVEQCLYSLPEDIDLLVLPELFSTGYIANNTIADSLAETNDGDTIRLISSLAKQHRLAICGSFLARNVDAPSTEVYNRAFFMEPNNEVAYYDKRHLFVLGEEAHIFSPGQSLPPVIRYRGWNIMMSICYDIRFPVWLRNSHNKYDVLIVPANWPDRRGATWEKLLQARAIENISYIVGANRSGHDEFGTYDGLSYVYDYLGHSIGQANGSTIMATLDRMLLEEVKERFPAWKDADEFRIIPD